MAMREFRTGWTDIPDHVDAIMDFDTRNMTFDEAERVANERLTAKVFDRAIENMRSQHFRSIDRGLR